MIVQRLQPLGHDGGIPDFQPLVKTSIARGVLEQNNVPNSQLLLPVRRNPKGSMGESSTARSTSPYLRLLPCRGRFIYELEAFWIPVSYFLPYESVAYYFID